ncbi:MAG: hypothetical protein CVU42_02525 [Chloroflexi bacterium HGW-Chloroflexi-4]|nr:MAG: hypothetical protein CVU42_02525 [Chloroflexi bacterium HGW-Chloroflexi-4]
MRFYEVTIKNKIRDLRSYAKQTNIRLIVGALGLLFFVGLGLILLIYGKGAVFTGLLCVVGGLIPVFLIIAALALIELIVKKNRDQ